MGAGFNALAQAGVQNAETQAQNKIAEREQEHQQKITDLISQRQQLAAKIPSLDPNTPEYKQAHDALQTVNMNIADAYHPAKNPGAIEKFGHLITDHVGLTKPEDRAAKAAVATGNKNIAAAKATDQQVAAAPFTAVQVGAQQLAQKLTEIDHSNLSDEDKEDAKRKAFGITSPKPYMMQYKLANGDIQSYDVNHKELIPAGATELPKSSQTVAKENISQYDEAVKKGYKGTFQQWLGEQRRLGNPSTSFVNEYREDYAKSHGFGGYGAVPDEYRQIADDYIKQKVTMDGLYPTSTTTSHLQLDTAGQYHNVTETNYKTPGGDKNLKDPLWFLAPPVPGPNDAVQQRKAAAGDATPSTAPASGTKPAAAPAAGAAKPPRDPKALKKEASERAPKPPAGVGGAAPRSDGSTRVGNVTISAPIMPGKSKEYDDAQGAYDSAVSRVETMEKNAAKAYGGDQQAMLSLIANHIGMTLGAQKGARINQAVWNEAVQSAPGIDKVLAKFGHQEKNGDWVLDEPFAGYKGGVTLTGGQIKSMVELAHEQVDTFKHNRDRIVKRLNNGVLSPMQNPDGNSGGSTSQPATQNGLPKGWTP